MLEVVPLLEVVVALCTSSSLGSITEDADIALDCDINALLVGAALNALEACADCWEAVVTEVSSSVLISIIRPRQHRITKTDQNLCRISEHINSTAGHQYINDIVYELGAIIPQHPQHLE